MSKEVIVPIKVLQDLTNGMIIVCTRKDVRFIDYRNG